MNVKEHLQFLEGQISDCGQALQYGLEIKDYDMAALNIYERFMCRLTVGLIHWRLGLNPSGDLKQAVESVLEGRKTLIDSGSSVEDLQSLPLYDSIYVAFLLDMPHPALNLKGYSEELMPTAFFGNVLVGADSINNWTKYKNHLPTQKRTVLARATNDLYAGLLAGDITPEEGVKMGEKYYIRRKTDPYFLDGDMLHGGTEHNDRFVDYCLAAVLKKIGSTVPTVHAWRW